MYWNGEVWMNLNPTHMLCLQCGFRYGRDGMCRKCTPRPFNDQSKMELGSRICFAVIVFVAVGFIVLIALGLTGVIE